MHTLQVAVVVLGPDHHDGQFHDKRNPLLGVQRQFAQGVDGVLEILGSLDFEVAPSVVRALPRFDHEGEGHLLVCLAERVDQDLATVKGHLGSDRDPAGLEVLLLLKLVLDEAERAP